MLYRQHLNIADTRECRERKLSIQKVTIVTEICHYFNCRLLLFCRSTVTIVRFYKTGVLVKDTDHYCAGVVSSMRRGKYENWSRWWYVFEGTVRKGIKSDNELAIGLNNGPTLPIVKRSSAHPMVGLIKKRFIGIYRGVCPLHVHNECPEPPATFQTWCTKLNAAVLYIMLHFHHFRYIYSPYYLSFDIY